MDLKVPRWILITLGVAPVVAFFVLLAWGVMRKDADPGSLAVFNSSGESAVNVRVMPAFTLQTFDGKQFDSTALQGKVAMIDFWASWCPPCKAEAPALDRVYLAYKANGVEFVGVAIWDRDVDVQKFLAEAGTTFTTGKDPRGELAVEFGLTGIPEKYFVNTRGEIVRKFVGPMDEARLSKVLDEVLAQR